jgi:hypothetical protein
LKNTTALINSALATIVVLGSLGLADDTVAAEKKESEKCYAVAKGGQERLSDSGQRLCGIFQAGR